LVIEDFDEVVEAGLLLKEVGSGRLGGFFLQGKMNAFMAGLIRSMPIPSRSHQTASLLKLNKACAEAKGTPLSLRILTGRPRSLKSLSNTVKA
jgi:hypothetical protein